MVGPLDRKSWPAGATRRSVVGLILGAPLLGACAGVQQSLGQYGSQEATPGGPPQQPLAVGNGQVKVGLILPLSAVRQCRGCRAIHEECRRDGAGGIPEPESFSS